MKEVRFIDTFRDGGLICDKMRGDNSNLEIKVIYWTKSLTPRYDLGDNVGIQDLPMKSFSISKKPLIRIIKNDSNYIGKIKVYFRKWNEEDCKYAMITSNNIEWID
jgi:hypothetical protein